MYGQCAVLQIPVGAAAQPFRSSLYNLDDTLHQVLANHIRGERGLSDATRLHNATGHRTGATQ